MTATPADRRADAVARALHAREGTSAAWGVEFVEAGEGRAVCAMTVREEMLNAHGTAHGGAIVVLADTAFGWACNSRNETAVAHHVSVTYVSPAHPGDRLTASAVEVARKGRSGVYDVHVTADDGRTVAVFQGLSRTVGGPVVDGLDTNKTEGNEP
ncbi:MAG: hydroxyphenylacetyl-CoA thioesterase PaaI [Pseudomonadota bacterium]